MQATLLSFYLTSIRQLLPTPISVFQLDSCEAELKALKKNTEPGIVRIPLLHYHNYQLFPLFSHRDH